MFELLTKYRNSESSESTFNRKSFSIIVNNDLSLEFLNVRSRSRLFNDQSQINLRENNDMRIDRIDISSVLNFFDDDNFFKDSTTTMSSSTFTIFNEDVFNLLSSTFTTIFNEHDFIFFEHDFTAFSDDKFISSTIINDRRLNILRFNDYANISITLLRDSSSNFVTTFDEDDFNSIAVFNDEKCSFFSSTQEHSFYLSTTSNKIHFSITSSQESSDDFDKSTFDKSWMIETFVDKLNELTKRRQIRKAKIDFWTNRRADLQQTHNKFNAELQEITSQLQEINTKLKDKQSKIENSRNEELILIKSMKRKLQNTSNWLRNEKRKRMRIREHTFASTTFWFFNIIVTRNNRRRVSILSFQLSSRTIARRH